MISITAYHSRSILLGVHYNILQMTRESGGGKSDSENTGVIRREREIGKTTANRVARRFRRRNRRGFVPSAQPDERIYRHPPSPPLRKGGGFFFLRRRFFLTAVALSRFLPISPYVCCIIARLFSARTNLFTAFYIRHPLRRRAIYFMIQLSPGPCPSFPSARRALDPLSRLCILSREI